MSYEPTWESVASHPVPDWFEGAKLGVFLHWGLYSVPGWAPRVPDIQTILRHHGPRWLMRNNPYAEWYANTVRLDGSPTQRHHAETYGRETPYEAFVEPFDLGSSAADRYHPSVLWNDIGWPAEGDLPGLFAFYHNPVPDGVVNDRWVQPAIRRGALSDALVRVVGGAVEALWPLIPDRRKHLTVGGAKHFDFSTPEYEQFTSIVDRKWESTRGVGHSFGANRNEDLADVLSTTELVRSFVDIVSKNGNLLIGVGPTADGSIPDWQQAPLLGLGRWLRVNGEAIFDSRPWKTPSTTTSEGTEVRFTKGGDAVYAALLDTPGVAEFELRGVRVSEVRDVRLLGIDDGVDWSVKGDVLTLTLAGRLPVDPARTLRMFPSSSVGFVG